VGKVWEEKPAIVPFYKREKLSQKGQYLDKKGENGIKLQFSIRLYRHFVGKLGCS